MVYLQTFTVISTIFLVSSLISNRISDPFMRNIKRKYNNPSSCKGNANMVVRLPLQRLYSMNEWREQTFSVVTENDICSSKETNDGTIPPREVCLLPFPHSEILLQGQTKQIRIYEDRFIKLFQKSMRDHGGIIGMGLLISESGILKPIPLCKIESYQQVDGFGIFCTLRVVSRATLIRIDQYEPYMKAICVEKIDLPMENEKMDLLNFMASNIENFVVTLSSLENQLRLYDKDNDDSDQDRDFVLYDVDDEADELDREAIYRSAFQDAADTDCQGYMITSPSSTFSCINIGQKQRSIQDLTAISWAVFCSNNQSQEEDKKVTIRIQALDSSKLLDRLYMGLFVLREKKKELEDKLALVGRRKKQQLDD